MVSATDTPAKPRVPTAATILVVDDERVVTDMLSRVLEKQGYRVLRADSAVSALAILEEQAVDIMVSDIHMPGMNGLELTKQASQTYPDLSIVLMTGNYLKHDRRDALAAGADGYVTKPFKNQTLLDLVAQLIR